MDNCDLEKLSVTGGKLQPAFAKDVTNYKMTVASNVTKVTLDLNTSDCGASYKILYGDGTRTIKLNDGLNAVKIEVVAEDGSSKTYCVEIIKKSAKTAELKILAIKGDVPLHPAFCANTYEYSCTVPFHCNSVTMLTQLPDKFMTVSVNGDDSAKPVQLGIGETTVQITVCSADGSTSQVYILLVTRELIPLAVTFSNAKEQLEYECPVSLTAFYRPVSVRPSDPKHIFSGPYIEMLARRSKVDPLSAYPLAGGWKVHEPELENEMSTALVKCFFAYRGCESVVKLSEAGGHALTCPHKPSEDLDTKDVTETNWYKTYFASSSRMEIETKHTLEVRPWEKRLQNAVESDNVDNLCAVAKDHLKLYWQRLPKPGDVLQFEEGHSPLDSLEQAAVLYASAIKLGSKEARLHFLLGQTLEEKYYAIEMYGLKMQSERDSERRGEAKSTALQDDILAVCKLHGFPGTPTLENQLRALDAEYQHLKDQGLPGKADYIQTLYLWLSEKAGKEGRAGVRDEGNCIHQALVKYLDAWSLNPDHWEYNLHVGRLLLLQGRSKEALQHLQTGLALRPQHPGLRFYTGVALLQQGERVPEATEQLAALYLQHGLDHLLRQRCSQSDAEQESLGPLSGVSSQFLRGLLTLGKLQENNTLSAKAMSAELVYHTIAVLAAQGVCHCVCRGEVVQQLEWALLDAHFALLQRLIQQQQSQAGTDRHALVAKRCQALTALIRLTSITPCQELLDMQEKVCQVAVITSPQSSHALCLLGLAQLAQYDNHPDSKGSKVILKDACLSFQASIELEGTPQGAEAPPKLTKQKWWQDRLEADRERAAKQPESQPTGGKAPSDSTASGKRTGRGRVGPGRGGVAKAPGPIPTATKGGKAAPPPGKPPVARGRAGTTASKPDRTKPPGKPSSKRELSPSKCKPDGTPIPGKTTSEITVAGSGGEMPGPVNRRSHFSRLGLARALSRSADTKDQSRQLYRDVISMAPGVHDAYIELAEQLVQTDPQAAVEVYCRFPLGPADEQTFDDAFITGEIVHILMKLELYDHPQLGPNLIAHGKVMGMGCIEKYIDILDAKFRTNLLKSVYAGIHDKSVEDKDLQDFFKFKCWI